VKQGTILFKKSFQLLVEVLAGVDEMHDHKPAGVVERVRDAVLPLSHGEVERVEHVERAGQALTGERSRSNIRLPSGADRQR